MNINPDTQTVLSVGSACLNLLMMVVMLRVKVELAELKVWIFENFERRAHERG